MAWYYTTGAEAGSQITARNSLPLQHKCVESIAKKHRHKHPRIHKHNPNACVTIHSHHAPAVLLRHVRGTR